MVGEEIEGARAYKGVNHVMPLVRKHSNGNYILTFTLDEEWRAVNEGSYEFECPRCGTLLDHDYYSSNVTRCWNCAAGIKLDTPGVDYRDWYASHN